MQMLCKVSNCFSDVRCPVCGQGFVVFWDRSTPETHTQQRTEVRRGLRLHHAELSSAEAHPAAFSIPDAPMAVLPPPSNAVPIPALLGIY